MALKNLEFRRASACAASGCVEVAVDDDARQVFVRDSKKASAAPLSFDFDEWQQFVAGVKGGEFDAS